MKKVTEIVNEALAKDIKVPRKGSTVYLLKVGETQAIPVKVNDVIKVKTKWYGHSKGYDVHVELDDNKFNFTGWLTMHYGEPDLDKPIQVQIYRYGNGDDEELYVGTSKEAIAEYIKTNASKRLERVVKDIAKLEQELADLHKEKDKLEIDANTEITESLK